MLFSPSNEKVYHYFKENARGNEPGEVTFFVPKRMRGAGESWLGGCEWLMLENYVNVFIILFGYNVQIWIY